MTPSLKTKPGKIKLLALDVDGVLTDGTIHLNGENGETKVFFVQDGSALIRARKAGLLIAWISGRRCRAVELRAGELGVEYLYQGVEDKVEVIENLLYEKGVNWEQTAFIGDDLNDLPLILKAGWSAAVAQAHPRVLAAADYKTTLPGGHGAVREVVELILNAKGIEPDY
jgi:3-deoxy-D-manno-octulosonate 8-phosphate phosphatase (KDO 8-P phosphatase)